MATIRRRKSTWQAQIRRQGHQLSRTFRLRADAELWARQAEAELDRGGLPVDSRVLRSHTLADLLKRYAAEVSPRKRSANREVYMLRVILRHPIARLSLHLLTATEIAQVSRPQVVARQRRHRATRTGHRPSLHCGRKERMGFRAAVKPGPAGQAADGL